MIVHSQHSAHMVHCVKVRKYTNKYSTILNLNGSFLVLFFCICERKEKATLCWLRCFCYNFFLVISIRFTFEYVFVMFVGKIRRQINKMSISSLSVWVVRMAHTGYNI